MEQERAPVSRPVYFYHPDHLGSSTFLTDANGNPYQFFINLPFGETMAEQLPDTYYRTPFKFNGKELDEETGLYYYGARYYDPKISIWLSVDPLAESFPNWNPYNYCLQNPINMIDPDGRAPEDIIVTAKDGTKLFTLNDGKKTITTMTLQQLYKNKVQWFEPLADNYMPLKTLFKGASSDKLKHFTKKQIENFSNEDRIMYSYRKGGSGDWKKVKDGGNEYLAVTVDGMPYWGDAVGQIPFATNRAKDQINKGWDSYSANVTAIRDGQKYADGNPFGGTPDYSNSYDNYFILRGAMYGSEGRDITQPITEAEAKKYGYKKN